MHAFLPSDLTTAPPQLVGEDLTDFLCKYLNYSTVMTKRSSDFNRARLWTRDKCILLDIDGGATSSMASTTTVQFLQADAEPTVSTNRHL